MIFLPKSLSSRVSAEDAMPPPAACRIRLIPSHAQKKMVYVRGLKKAMCSPYTITILERQRYMAALKKAGAIVRVMR